MTDRVRRAEKFDAVLKLLKDEEKIFSSYKDVLVFAACLAKSRGQVKEEFSKSSEPIPLHVFNGEFDMTVISAIAISEPNDCEVNFLSEKNQDRKILIFEEYAASGLKIIAEVPELLILRLELAKKKTLTQLDWRLIRSGQMIVKSGYLYMTQMLVLILISLN